jgi:hypothetical protein
VITASGPLPIGAELRALETEFPRFHCWLSDAGVVHATTCQCPDPEGCGTTLEAPNPQQMRHVIAAQVHAWAVSGVAA